MSWKKEVFKNFKLYAVTNIRRSDTNILSKIEQAYRGGADIVQLRSKELSDRELCDVAAKARVVADEFRRLLFVNDRIDVALAIQADGVHLGQDDLPIRIARRMASQMVGSENFFIGKSTHSIQQAVEAESQQPDYIGVGPVFQTPTKPTYEAVGLELVHQVKQRIKIPFVAIGGIDAGNLSEVLKAGANRVAVVRAIFESEDIVHGTQALRSIIAEYESSYVEV